jgi:hypothetical protein
MFRTFSMNRLKQQISPKPFLWLFLLLAVATELLVVYWMVYAAWMNAHPLYDDIYWAYVFNFRTALFLVGALICIWLIVRLVRLYRHERESNRHEAGG